MPGIDRTALTAIVEEAGDIALKGFREGEEVERWHKAPDQPLTASDIAVDNFLRTALRDLDPKMGWLSEESQAVPETAKSAGTWIVDPIDGTRDFMRGRSGWALSVAYCVGGQPQLAALYAPARQEMWFAEAGNGAMLNGTSISASRHTELQGARVPTTQLSNIDQQLAMVEKPNSIALRMAMVANDQADLVATLRWGHAWDVAAALLIAREAGALCTDALGQNMDFSDSDAPIFGILCSARNIHGAALKHLESRARNVLEQQPIGRSAASLQRHQADTNKSKI
ncbi:MAG: inositol monophosphatase [Pseudomonadota bacterium]